MQFGLQTPELTHEVVSSCLSGDKQVPFGPGGVTILNSIALIHSALNAVATRSGR